QAMSHTGCAIAGYSLRGRDRANGLERIADFQRIVNVPTIEVDPANAVDPEQLFRDDLFENVVELFVLGKPAMTADVEPKLAVIGLLANRPRQSANERRSFDDQRVFAVFAEVIRRAKTPGPRSHHQRQIV